LSAEIPIADPVSGQKEPIKVIVEGTGHEIAKSDPPTEVKNPADGSELASLGPRLGMSQQPQQDKETNLPATSTAQPEKANLQDKTPIFQPLRVLINWDELSDKMDDFYLDDDRNFWLCGKVKDGKLFDMVLHRGSNSRW
jgi:hypothetical protein